MRSRSSGRRTARSRWRSRCSRCAAGLLPAGRRVCRQADRRRGRRGARGLSRDRRGGVRPRRSSSWLVVGVLAALLAAAQRGIDFCQSLLRALLRQRVNLLILDKALTLELAQFEDSRALRQADARAARGFVAAAVARHADVRARAERSSLIGLGGLLAALLAVARRVLIAAAMPRVRRRAEVLGRRVPRCSRWRTPETREQMYLEIVLAREDHAKEVKLFGLGPRFLGRYKAIFDTLYAERSRSSRSGARLGLRARPRSATPRSTACTLWIAIVDHRRRDHARRDDDVRRACSSQGQSALSTRARRRSAACTRTTSTCRTSTSSSTADDGAAAARRPRARSPATACASSTCAFTYPGARDAGHRRRHAAHPRRASKLAIVGENGSGKTTLIKLLDAPLRADARHDHARRPRPARVGPRGAAPPHRRHLPGLRALPAHGRREHRRRRRTARTTIATRWERRGRARARASRSSRHLPARYDTQLGRWFNAGRELSGGQWQKIALARAFMRERRRHPRARRADRRRWTPRPRRKIFERFRELTDGQDRDRDLAPVLDGAHGRPDRRARPRRDHRARHARRARCSSAAATPRCSTCRRRATGEAAPAGLFCRARSERTTPAACALR